MSLLYGPNAINFVAMLATQGKESTSVSEAKYAEFPECGTSSPRKCTANGKEGLPLEFACWGFHR
jgi:hypothetical protein